MRLDVANLRAFYETALGRSTKSYLAQVLARRWSNCAGLSMLGLGYATPFLEPFRAEALRTLAFMPAEQGVVVWPRNGPRSAALIDSHLLPLPDSCIDRVLLVHALEASDQPQDLLDEVWRVLAPGGALVLIAPNRTGLWSRVDSTPFGQGRPYSRGQLRDLIHDAQFSPAYWGEALYGPPFSRDVFLRLSPFLEKLGGQLSLPGAGVHVVEATKEVYRPIPLRRRRRVIAIPEPALAPAPQMRPAACDRQPRHREDAP
jgi:SAM-dependent methyltransferase